MEYRVDLKEIVRVDEKSMDKMWREVEAIKNLECIGDAVHYRSIIGENKILRYIIVGGSTDVFSYVVTDFSKPNEMLNMDIKIQATYNSFDLAHLVEKESVAD